MSKKMVLSSLLVSTTVLTTPVKADVVTFTSSSDVVTNDTTMDTVSEPINDTTMDTVSEPINDTTMDTISVTKSVPEVVPIAESINEQANVQSTEVKPVGTLIDLRQKPVGTLKALQMLPDTSSTSGKSSIIIGVMTLLFGLIGLLHMYAKRIFG